MSECSLSKSDERIPTSCAPHPTYPTPFRSLTRQPVPRSHSPSPCLAWCHPPAHTLQPIAARTPPRGHARETCRFNKESATRPGSWPCRRYPSRGEVPKPRGGSQAERRFPSREKVPNPRGGSQPVDHLGTHHQAWEAWSRKPIRPTCPHRAVGHRIDIHRSRLQ
jgi:hypothetical protein